MRNDFRTKVIFSLVKNLPYFKIGDLKGIEKNEDYLKVLLSRYCKKGEIVRLKKGLYTPKDFIDKAEKEGNFSSYLEFLVNTLYFPSYLSLDYILYKHNILTEIPRNFTAITLNKTKKFSNKFGNFIYHKVKEELFLGFKVFKKGDFFIYEATKPKALFDFLYLRKNLLVDRKAVEELRLNIENFTEKDKKELRKYINLEGSKKIKKILSKLFNL